MGKISPEDAATRLGELPGWKIEGVTLQREFSFQGFADAIAFVVRLGFAAEVADHHPDLQVQFRRVVVTYTTHSAGGLTDKDFDGAETASRIADAMGVSR